MKYQCRTPTRAVVVALIAIIGFVEVRAEHASANTDFDAASANLQKVMALVREKLELQKRLQLRLTELKKQYPGDTGASFGSADLISRDGIREARGRSQQYSSMVKDLVATHRQDRNDWEALVLQAHLPEPYASQISVKVAEAKPEFSKRSAEWLEADSQNALAISRLLSFTERNTGKIRMEHGELVFAHAALETEYNKLLQSAETTELRSSEAGRALLYADDGTTALLRAAILEYRSQLDSAR
jgi:hypothetical protein